MDNKIRQIKIKINKIDGMPMPWHWTIHHDTPGKWETGKQQKSGKKRQSKLHTD